MVFQAFRLTDVAHFQYQPACNVFTKFEAKGMFITDRYTNKGKDRRTDTSTFLPYSASDTFFWLL